MLFYTNSMEALLPLIRKNYDSMGHESHVHPGLCTCSEQCIFSWRESYHVLSPQMFSLLARQIWISATIDNMAMSIKSLMLDPITTIRHN